MTKTISPNSNMDLRDRYLIELGICGSKDFKTIATEIHRSPVTIAREVKKNRFVQPGIYPFGNDCMYAKACYYSHLCGEMTCMMYCKSCCKDCHNYCEKYVSNACHKFDKPPYCCNACSKRKNCTDTKYFYSSQRAQAFSEKRFSAAHQGVRLPDDELLKLDKLLSEMIVRKGQPIQHICATYKQEIPVCSRTIYNYIDKGVLSVRNIDLRRKTNYRRRRNRSEEVLEQELPNYRQGRTYADYKAYMEGRPEHIVTEMDTVHGKRGYKTTLLTMIMRRNSVMLLFLLPDCKQSSVIRCIDFLEEGLGHEVFSRLFPLILTDNGGEFKNAVRIEMNNQLETRTTVYYCDPMASWQKPHIEKNHEYIRYVIPKGHKLEGYTTDDITLLMNTINSVRRDALEGCSPYELIRSDDTDMHKLMQLMRMEEIPPQEVVLLPSLLNRRKDK